MFCENQHNGGSNADHNFHSSDVFRLRNELTSLRQQEALLDELLNECKMNLDRSTEDPNQSQYSYVTYPDIRGCECFDDETVFAVRAPPNTKLEVPDPTTVGIQIYSWLNCIIDILWRLSNKICYFLHLGRFFYVSEEFERANSSIPLSRG